MPDNIGEKIPFRWAWGDTAQKAAWHKYWVHDVVHGLLGFGLYYGVKPYPVRWVSAVGAWAGATLGPKRGPVWDRRARENIKRLRPDLDADATVRRMWRNVGRAMLEMSALDRLRKGKRVRFVNQEHLLAAKRDNRPRILLMLHLGNWELMGGVLHMIGEHCLHFYMPPRNRFERFLVGRARHTVRSQLLLPNAAETLKGVRFLLTGEGPLVIAGDELIDGRVNGPFFGRTPRLDGNIGFAARMAVKSGAVIIPAYTLREPGAHFAIHFEPPVEVAEGATAAERIERTTLAINAAIEPIVLEHIDQWLMLHDLRFDRD